MHHCQLHPDIRYCFLDTIRQVSLGLYTKKPSHVSCHIFAGLLGSTRFIGSSRNYSTLLLEEEARLLYVGGRGALYALNTSSISTPANLTVSAKMLRNT